MTEDRRLYLLKKKLGDKAKPDEPLAEYTTFKIGGPADWFYEAKTEKELVKAVSSARELEVPCFILGGGSNLLVSDKGFRGLVIRIQETRYTIQETRIVAWAGTPLAKLVEAAAEDSLSGLEFCVGIPGTIGGAVCGNSGLKDKAFGDLVETVKVLNENGDLVVLNNSQCQFGYRRSIFQKKPAVILEVTLKLKSGNQKEIKKEMQQYLNKRKNQPKEPSAGSIFKNPPGKSAGELIDQVGLKGETLGQAQIAAKHANWIINLGGASCQDVLKLILLAKKKVKEKFGLELREEIRVVGGQ